MCMRDIGVINFDSLALMSLIVDERKCDTN
jgi:hypothetical protein